MAEFLEPALEAFNAIVDAIEPAESQRRWSTRGQFEVLNFGQLIVVDHGEFEGDLGGVLGRGGEKVALGTESAAH